MKKRYKLDMIYLTTAIAIIIILFFFMQTTPPDVPTLPDWVKVDDLGWCDVMFLDNMYFSVSKDGKSVVAWTKDEYKSALEESCE